MESIIGLWKIVEVNVMDMEFNQTWRSVEDLTADEAVHPMQKAMAQAKFLFREDGKALQLMPKALDTRGEHEAYDDSYVIGRETDWKEDGGKRYLSTVENGNVVWQEIVPSGDGYVIFDMFKIVRA